MSSESNFSSSVSAIPSFSAPGPIPPRFSRVAGVLLKLRLDGELQTEKLLGLIQDKDFLDSLFEVDLDGTIIQLEKTIRASQIVHMFVHRCWV